MKRPQICPLNGTFYAVGDEITLSKCLKKSTFRKSLNFNGKIFDEIPNYDNQFTSRSPFARCILRPDYEDRSKENQGGVQRADNGSETMVLSEENTEGCD